MERRKEKNAKETNIPSALSFKALCISERKLLLYAAVHKSQTPNQTFDGGKIFYIRFHA